MQITYHGLSSVRILLKPIGRAMEDIVLYFDPVDEKNSKYRNIKADMVFCSQKCEYLKNNSTQENFLCVFDSPGEYSVRGIDITGFDASLEKKENVVFIVRGEDISLAHLGKSQMALSEKQLESLIGIDILFFPFEEKDESTRMGVELVRKIEPKVVIPMVLNDSFSASQIKRFFEEMGFNTGDPVNRFVCKKKDIIEKEMEIVLFGSSQ